MKIPRNTALHVVVGVCHSESRYFNPANRASWWCGIKPGLRLPVPMSSGWISHGACVLPEFHYDFCIPPTPNSLSIL